MGRGSEHLAAQNQPICALRRSRSRRAPSAPIRRYVSLSVGFGDPSDSPRLATHLYVEERNSRRAGAPLITRVCVGCLLVVAHSMGSTSARVHPRRPPSQAVHLGPLACWQVAALRAVPASPGVRARQERDQPEITPTLSLRFPRKSGPDWVTPEPLPSALSCRQTSASWRPTAGRASRCSRQASPGCGRCPGRTPSEYRSARRSPPRRA